MDVQSNCSQTALAGFIAIYTVLLIIEMKLMLKAIRKGPEIHAPAQ